MQAESEVDYNENVEETPVLSGNVEICTTPEEQERLLKLFQLFIEIDKNLKKKNDENRKRGTDRTRKAE